MIWVLYWFLAGLVAGSFYAWLAVNQKPRVDTNGEVTKISLFLFITGFLGFLIMVVSVVYGTYKTVELSEWWNKR